MEHYQPIIFFYPDKNIIRNYAPQLNAGHFHLFNGQNIFARKRLAAEHGIKFGFVVKPKNKIETRINGADFTTCLDQRREPIKRSDYFFEPIITYAGIVHIKAYPEWM